MSKQKVQLLPVPARKVRAIPSAKRLPASIPGPTGVPGPASVSIEIRWPNGATFGPEELALIDMIRKEQSIIGASRALGLSYRKCWLIADMLNRCFESPVIATFPGRRTAGAEITPFGERLVALYRSIGRHAAASSKKSLDELTASLDWAFDPKARAAASARDQA